MSDDGFMRRRAEACRMSEQERSRRGGSPSSPPPCAHSAAAKRNGHCLTPGSAASGQRTLRVLHVDTHPDILDALKYSMEREQVEIVGSVEKGDVAMRLARRTKPDVLVSSILGIAPFRWVPTLLCERPGTRVLFWSACQQESIAREAFKIGATGYVAKPCRLETILDAVYAVAAGETVWAPYVEE